MSVLSIECATPKGKKPAPKGTTPTPRRANGTIVSKTSLVALAANVTNSNKTSKLPVPPPKTSDSVLDIPESLKIDAEQRKAGWEKLDKANSLRGDKGGYKRPTDPGTAKVAAEIEDKKRTKAQVKREQKAAVESGATKAMPASGKNALAVIAAEAIENGHKVTKVPQGVTAATVAANKTKGGKGTKIAKNAPSEAPKAAAKASRGEHGRPGSKLALVADMLKRKEGCTTAEVLAATGWPAVSMPQQARAAGLTLVKEKVGKVTRYRAK